MRAFSLLLLATLAACEEERPDTGTAPLPPSQTDDDGDGATADVDCDDADAAVRPGASEHCDGVDQDCDGLVDEDATDAGAWYPDRDDDGVGNPVGAERTCEAPSGFVAVDGDCDDTDGDVFPGAEERCNDADDDCDGEIDEGDPPGGLPWYRDADGDAFGTPDDVVIACDRPDGYSSDATDCDDGKYAVNPGADETCDPGDQDCDGEVDEDPADGDWYFVDADGDGYGAGDEQNVCRDAPGYSRNSRDCDDTDAAVYPDAPEQCDGVDDDCDGTVDEGGAGSEWWYPDLDGDGYGDDTARVYGCDAPAGWIAAGGDCDDADAGVNAGAVETCNAVDDDCDGRVDTGAVDEATWYADADGDGFGDAAAAVATCDTPVDHVADATDCDDTSALASPGRPEVCTDGLDNDCDGTDNGCVRTGAVNLADVFHARVSGGGDDILVGAAVAGATDLDGDGVPDVLVGVPGWDEALLYSGTPGGELGPYDTAAYFYADVPGDWGSAVAAPGDIDGDGDGDAMVGGPDAPDGGGVVVLPGNWYGARTLTDALLTLEAEGADDRLGAAVAGAGDLDGDGLADLVVGAPGATGGGVGSGAAYVVYGGVSGTLALGLADGTLLGAHAYDGLGNAVAGVGDVDGDGLDDVLVGASSDRTGALLAGAAYLVRGPFAGVYAGGAADAVFLGEAIGDFAGASVAAAGDTDGDGAPELVVGASHADGGGADAGAAYLLRGPFAGTTSLASGVALYGADANDQAGYAVAGIGDHDADGVDDLAVGAWASDATGSTSGSVYVLYGPGPWSSDLALADLVLRGASPSRTGAALWGSPTAGDLTGDGASDLLVGAPLDASSGASSGAAYVVPGRGW